METGDLVTKFYTIRKIDIKKNYISIILKDIEGDSITGRLRDNMDLFLNSFKEGDSIVCKARVKVSRKNQYLDIIYIRRPLNEGEKNKNEIVDEEQQETKQFKAQDEKKEQPIEKQIIITEEQFDIFISEFDRIIENIKDKDYRQILDSIFTNDIREMFFEFPAAKSIHHNYPHGLLQHTIETVSIALYLANNFVEEINLDLLATGCLIHDIGKLKAYEYDFNKYKETSKMENIVRTDWDDLLGHLSMSCIFVSKVISAEINQYKAMALYHLLLAHHGKNEWGSPVVPRMKEAYILHESDVLSTNLNCFNKLIFDDKTGWSLSDKVLRRKWFSKFS